MRISTSMIYDQLLRSLQSTQQDYAGLETQLATGKKLLAPSDDVIGASRALDYRVEISANDQYAANITGATSNLNLTNTALTSLSDAVSQLKSLATTNQSGSSDPGTQATSAQQASLLRDSLYDISNTNIGGRYLFSGYRTDQKTYTPTSAVVGGVTVTTYAYNGDNGVINVPVDRGAAAPINVTGNEAFSLNLAAPYTQQISTGQIVHYTPVAGTTTVNVEIRQSDDVARPTDDTFSFSNAMEMADVLGTALGTNNIARVQAMVDPLEKLQGQVAQVQADVGTRLSGLNDQTSMLTQNSNVLTDSLSSVEDADTTETAVLLQKTDTALQTLLASGAKILSQSLLDFLQ